MKWNVSFSPLYFFNFINKNVNLSDLLFKLKKTTPRAIQEQYAKGNRPDNYLTLNYNIQPTFILPMY